MTRSIAFRDPEVDRVFESFPPQVRRKLLALRELIFSVAASTQSVGEIDESLKWGEPTYSTLQSKTGSPVRIGWKKARPTQYAMYFNCQTTLVETFRTLFPNEFRFEGNRAIVFDVSEAVPIDSLSLCISAALTYHRGKRR
jgi:Domain of unknown function (DU1801)